MPDTVLDKNSNQLSIQLDYKNELKTEKEIKQINTSKILFDKAYKDTVGKKKKEREKIIKDILKPYFKYEQILDNYISENFERKKKNLICRRVRMVRKINLHDFNYFVTFTYDDKKHTEISFKKKLKNSLAHFANRKNWRYVGVWERAPQTDRLHFHGIFDIPNGTMPGMLQEIRDYDLRNKKMRTTFQNSYFNESFGRSDFERIVDKHRKGEAIAYLMKYIEKTGERIVYSRNLPQYFKSDILENDIITTIGQEERKVILYDDFECWRDGEFIGIVGPDVIKKLRGVNA